MVAGVRLTRFGKFPQVGTLTRLGNPFEVPITSLGKSPQVNRGVILLAWVWDDFPAERGGRTAAPVLRDRLKPGTPQFEARQRRWRHNGYLGSVAMARQAMIEISQGTTTTEESKALAVEIENLLDLLMPTLKHRKD